MARKQMIHTLETLAERIEEVGECDEWQGYHQERVPYVHHRGRMQSVRRLIWLLMGKKIEDGEYVTQKCRNGSCVKFEHMKVVTHQEMTKIAGTHVGKAASRKRKISFARRKSSKLDEESVRQIRLSTDPAHVECLKHGIGRSTVIAIRSNRIWKDLSMFGGLMR